MRRVFRIPFARAHVAREVDDELAFHLEMRAQRLIAAGWAPDAAHQEALRQFGDVAGVRESCVTMDEQRERTMTRTDRLADLRQDLVYALRMLRRNRGFTAVVVGALALGIGANTAIFTLVDAVLLRTLPVSHPEQLVAIGDPARVSSFSQGDPRTDLFSYPLYLDIRRQSHVLTDVAATGRADRLDVRIDGMSGELEHPRGRLASDNYFTMLGVRAQLGRVFGPSEQIVGGSPVAVISHGYWLRRFQGSPSVIGREILIDGARFTIVGVAPESFTGTIVGASPDVWLPIGMIDVMHPHQRILDDRVSNLFLLLGRRPAGTTLEQVRRALGPFIIRTITANATGPVAQAFLALKPKIFVSDGSRGFSRVRRIFHAPLVTLMIGVALLLCIICANVANLLLARAIARGREMAVRLALGAGRARITRQLLTESALLAAIAAAVGLFVAWWGSRALLVLAANGGSLPIDLPLDGRVLAFTIVVSIGAVALFGLAPALRASRVELASAMRATTTSASGSTLGRRGQRAPLGQLLIAGQVALSTVLLVGAAMLVRSLRNVQATDVGLDRNHLVIADLDIVSRGYTGGRRDEVLHAMRDRLASIPGVAAVTSSENGIFSGTENGTSIEVPGFVPRTVQDTNVMYDRVSPGYVHAIGGTLLAGRDIESSDEPMLPRAIVVNEAFAKFYFPGQPVIGKYITMNDTAAFRIVGEMADTHDHTLEDPPVPRMYVSYIHAPDPKNMGQPGSLRFIVRASGDPAALVQPIRKTIVSVDPLLPIDHIDPLTTLIRDTISQERLLTQLASGFGALALLLAGIGLYGVMSYAIGRRTGEIGLRIALGAGGGAVARMVLIDALRLVALGLIVGVPLALLSVRALGSQLHGVQTIDPSSLAIAVGVLVASAIAAVVIPAARAAHISPIVALKGD